MKKLLQNLTNHGEQNPMDRIRAAYKNYLSRMNRLQEVNLGSSDKPHSVTEEDNQFLSSLLQKELNFNRKLVLIFVTMLLVLFGMGLFLTIYFIHSPKTIGIVFGGTFLSLLAIIEKLHRLWEEKSKMDITLSLAQNLPPAETVKVIETLYWNMIREK